MKRWKMADKASDGSNDSDGSKDDVLVQADTQKRSGSTSQQLMELFKVHGIRIAGNKERK